MFVNVNMNVSESPVTLLKFVFGIVGTLNESWKSMFNGVHLYRTVRLGPATTILLYILFSVISIEIILPRTPTPI